MIPTCWRLSALVSLSISMGDMSGTKYIKEARGFFLRPSLLKSSITVGPLQSSAMLLTSAAGSLPVRLEVAPRPAIKSRTQTTVTAKKSDIWRFIKIIPGFITIQANGLRTINSERPLKLSFPILSHRTPLYYRQLPGYKRCIFCFCIL